MDTTTLVIIIVLVSFCYLAAAGTAADAGTKRGYEPIEIDSRD
jgi:hypothetical protein